MIGVLSYTNVMMMEQKILGTCVPDMENKIKCTELNVNGNGEHCGSGLAVVSLC